MTCRPPHPSRRGQPRTRDKAASSSVRDYYGNARPSYHGCGMSLLLAVDVGNTNTVLGVFRGDELVANWRIQTVAGRTSDEIAVLVRSLLELDGFAWGT